MTCTKRGCRRKAKFFRPHSDVAFCRPHFNAHTRALRKKPASELWQRVPKMILGTWVKAGDPTEVGAR